MLLVEVAASTAACSLLLLLLVAAAASTSARCYPVAHKVTACKSHNECGQVLDGVTNQQHSTHAKHLTALYTVDTRTIHLDRPSRRAAGRQLQILRGKAGKQFTTEQDLDC